MKRYYLLIGVSLFLTGTYSFLFNSERSVVSILFTTIAMAIPAGIGFLFIDYSLTLNNKHHLMKYYYASAIIVYLLYLPVFQTLPYIDIVRLPFNFIFGIATIAIIVAFFKFALGANNWQQDFDHPMHILADEYQKRKEKQLPWEEHMYDFFEEKFNLWKEKRKKSAA